MRTIRTFALLLLICVSVMPGGVFAAEKNTTVLAVVTSQDGTNDVPTENTTQTTPVPTTNTGTKNSTDTGTKTGGLTNPLNASSLQDLLQLVLHTVVQLGSILLVLALVWVGFLFVAAQGSEEKIRDARNALVWTVVGGLVLLGAEAISAAIQATVSAL